VKRSVAPLIVGVLILASRIANAQVGYPPARSPYLDLEHSQSSRCSPARITRTGIRRTSGPKA